MTSGPTSLVPRTEGRTGCRVEWAVRCSRPSEAGPWGGRPARRGCLAELQARVREILEEDLGTPTLDRVVAGNEFCARRLPSPRALERFLDEAGERRLPVTLATPLLDDRSLDRLRRLLRLLEGRAPGSEVVFQDWGVLQVLGRDHPDLVPVLGRTLVRMLRDPRVPADWLGGPGAVAPSLRQSDLALPAFRKALLRRGVERVEVDPPGLRCDLGFLALGLRAHLCLPFTFVASGRACRVGSQAVPREAKFRPGTPCRRECREVFTELLSPRLALRLFHRGNTALSLQPLAALRSLPAVIEQADLARLVYDPEAGFP